MKKYNWIVGQHYKDKGGRNYVVRKVEEERVIFDRAGVNEAIRNLDGSYPGDRFPDYCVAFSEFDIEEATDAELAAEARRLWLQYAPIAKLLREKGYQLQGYGVSEANVSYKVTKKIEQKIEL